MGRRYTRSIDQLASPDTGLERCSGNAAGGGVDGIPPWFSPSPHTPPTSLHVFPVLLTFQRGRLEHTNRKYKMKKYRFLAAMFCALSPLAYAAADANLDEIVVTATRIEQPLRQSLSSTSIISRQEIEESQAVDVPSVLKNLAGVEFYQSGGTGKQSSIFMRGTNSNQVLVLLDGIRISSATSGASAIDQIMLDQVERIEVVRGNVSSLYGSDAIGGVIQIFTRRGKGEMAFNASAGIGSHNTQRASAGIGGQSGSTNFNMQASRFRTDGISAINPAIVSNANPDNDGYDNTSLSVNVRHAFSADHKLSADVFNSEGHNHYDNAFGLPVDINENTAQLNKFSLTSDNRLNEIWQSKLQLAQGVDDYKGYANGVQSSAIKTGNVQALWQNTLALSSRGKLLLGLESLNQKVTSQTAYTNTERKVSSVLAGYTGNYGSHQVQMNARQDSYSDFGATNTGLLAYGYAVDDALRLTASVSSAFKAPTFNDLYGPAGWGSNPNLRPERSNNNEIGLNYAVANRSVDLIYFDNRTYDLIVADSAWTMQNINQARINGVELSYAEQFNDTNVKASLTRQNPRDDETDQLLLRRAKLYASLSVSRQLGAWRVGGEWQYSDVREDNHITAWPGQRVVLPAYNLVNAIASYAFDKRLNLSLRADNLFNQDYVLAHGYNTLGRNLFVSMNYQQ
jgi:vitamin B12 transporter